METIDLETPGGLLKAALFVGVLGIALLSLGLFLGKKWQSLEKAHDRGLDRPRNWSFTEESIAFHRNPDITIPMMFIVFGVLLVLAGILALVGAGIKAVLA